VLTMVCAGIVAAQFIPVRWSLSDLRETRKDVLVSYGQPRSVVTTHTAHDLKALTTTPRGRYVSWSAVAVDIGAAAALLACLWFAFCRTGVRLRWRLTVGTVALLVFGWSLLVSPMTTLRRVMEIRTTEFLANAITQLTQLTSNPSWIEHEAATLRERGLKEPSDNSGVGQRLILMKNGEWIAYFQECTKADPTVADVFIGCGSDGKWYYTECHFCINMLVAYEYAPYADLKAFVDFQQFSFTQFDRPPGAERLYQGGWFVYRKQTSAGGRRVGKPVTD